LKARALTGERGAELDELIVPFVFRKYLDYDAYTGLRDVHRQIREQGRRKDHARNIKLGPGGIREIEFIVQALQLVRGGKEPALRVRATLPALAAPTFARPTSTCAISNIACSTGMTSRRTMSRPTRTSSRCSRAPAARR